MTPAIETPIVEKTISTHTPLARCDVRGDIYDFIYDISTHTPLARCDSSDSGDVLPPSDFYSHTSCEV